MFVKQKIVMRSFILFGLFLLPNFILAQQFDSVRALTIRHKDDIFSPSPSSIVVNPRLASDRFNSVYYSGQFKDTLAVLGNDDIISSGDYDGYLIKFRKNLNVEWTRKITGYNDQSINDVAVDLNGNVMITGTFQGDTYLEGVHFSGGGAFIAKYDSAGALLWAKKLDGLQGVYPNRILTMNNGDVVISGSLYASINFGCSILHASSVPTKFIARYNSNGDCVMAKSFEVTYLLDMASDGENNIVITGGFLNTATFGSIEIQANWQDIYVAKCDKDGNWLWAKAIGGDDEDEGLGVSIDPLGNVIVTGHFRKIVSFENTTLTSSGASDIFIVSFNALGTLNWVRQAGGGVGNQYGFAVNTDSAGNVIVTGSIIDITHFGNFTIDPQGEASYVTMYNKQGICQWATGVTGSGSRGVDINSGGGMIFLAGESYGSNSILNFGDYAIVAQHPDTYLARIQYSPREIQTLTFESLAPKVATDDAFDLQASSSAGLPVRFTSSDPTVATVSGTTVTIVGAGSARITASQPGNDYYDAALNVDQTLTISKATQTISFSALEPNILGNAPFNLTATASSGLPVQYSSDSDKVSILSNVVTLVKAGGVTITAAQSGDMRYSAATNIDQHFCINPTKPTISIEGVNTEAPVMTSSSNEGNQWFLNDVAIDGAIHKTFTAAESGTYTVRVAVDNCLSEFSQAKVLIIMGVLDFQDSDIRAYPNPVGNYLELVSVAGDIGTSQLIDMTGRNTTIHFEKSGDVFRANVQHLSRGTYVLRLQVKNTVKQIRFIKK